MSAFDTAWAFLKEDLDPEQTKLTDFFGPRKNLRKPTPLKRRRAPPKVVVPDEKPPTDITSAWAKNRSKPDPEAAARASEEVARQIQSDAGIGHVITCPDCGKYTSIPQFMNPTKDELCGSITVGGQCSGPV